MSQILIIDDDKAFRESMVATVRALGHQPVESPSAEAALPLLSDEPALVFLDLRMQRMQGLDFLRLVRQDSAYDLIPIVVLTAFADSANTIEAMKLGAFDHLTKPIGREDVKAVIQRALSRPRLADTSLASELPKPGTLIGASPAMHEVQKRIGLSAASDATVLVLGETGTGKELVARALHQHSRRHVAPFVAINCAAIPTELLESELFGHVRGAFTGAMMPRAGRFKEAEGGTLFLDEIGDMSLPMQAKVLRAIQEKVITPVGGTTSQRVDLRFIAGTHRGLVEMVKAGTFREDLFYRLNVVTIHLPPLRERGSDILTLAEYFLHKVCPDNPKRLSMAAAATLQSHLWPGNVRELENLMQQLSLTVRGPIIDRQDLPLGGQEVPASNVLEELLQLDLATAVSRLEKMLLERALRTSDGNRSEAARRLGMHRQLFYKKLKEFELD